MKLALARALIEVASARGAPRAKLLDALGVEDFADEDARVPLRACSTRGTSRCAPSGIQRSRSRSAK